MKDSHARHIGLDDDLTTSTIYAGSVSLLDTPVAIPSPPAAPPSFVGRFAAEPRGVGRTSTAAELSAPPSLSGYEILEPLGVGGMGVVYRARQIKANRLVALKTLRAGAHADPAQRTRFYREIEAIAALQHPHIVPIYEVGEQSGYDYFSMEYMAGGSLDRRMAGVPQPPRAAAELVRILADAAHYAHQCGIVHRDLKPGNVMLSADGTPKLADFGLAKRMGGLTGATQTGNLLGTPLYMAPEQLDGGCGPSVDIYAMGVILYELLTGRPPHRGVTLEETLQQIVSQPPAPPATLQHKLPRDLETICLKCLQKDPSQRYADAAALADDLRRFLAGEPIAARRPGLLRRGALWSRRRPALAGLIAVLALSVAAAVVGLAWHNSELHDSAERERMLAASADSARIAAERHAADADLQRAEADRQRVVAEANLAKARKGATRWMSLARMVCRTVGTAKVRTELLEEAIAAFEELPPDSDRDLRLQSALTYSTMAYGMMRDKNPHRAMEISEKAVRQSESLAGEFPEEKLYRYTLANCLTTHGCILTAAHRSSDAEPMLRRSMGIVEPLLRDEPDSLRFRNEKKRTQLELDKIAAVRGSASVVARSPDRDADRAEGVPGAGQHVQ